MPASESATTIQRRVALSACFGTFLEWYDFLSFAALAAVFSQLFFPQENPVAALLASLGTFAIGMIVRPLGSAWFGSLGDRIGRRTVFLITIVLMGGATFCVGLLPTYTQAGLVAPILLLLLRMVQGLAVGGEIGGAAVYLTEHAPDKKRGLYTSVLQLMGPLGMMASSAQVIFLQSWLSEAEFLEWGWRVPFLLSAVLLAVSLKTRLNLHESPVFRQLRERNAVAKAPLRECFRDRHTLGRMGLLFFCISAGGSLLFFSSQVYSGIFLKNVVKLEASQASGLVLIATLALFPLTLLCGWLSDRIGRRPVIVAGLILGCASLLPVFNGLLHFGNPALEAFNDKAVVLLQGPDCDYSPFSKAETDCQRYQERLTRLGVKHRLDAGPQTQLQVGEQLIAGFDEATMKQALLAQGWSEKATPENINRPMLILLLMIPVVALALVTGPQTATLAELFPAHTRYSAVALPHNLSAGWIGGMSPFMVTLLSVQAGNPQAGLWYPVGLLIMAAAVGLLFMPEVRNRPLHE